MPMATGKKKRNDCIPSWMGALSVLWSHADLNWASTAVLFPP